jgi:hypothetical protein
LAERQRQSLIGYDNLPTYKNKAALRVYVCSSRDKSKLRIGVNETQLLVNSLSIATVCSEARSHAVGTAHAKIRAINLFYGLDDNDNNFSEPLREPIVSQPTTVMVTNAIQNFRRQGEDDKPPGFDSAAHVVDIVSRVFGKCVTRVDLNPIFHSQWESLERIYWPHTEATMRSQRRFVFAYASVYTRLQAKLMFPELGDLQLYMVPKITTLSKRMSRPPSPT